MSKVVVQYGGFATGAKQAFSPSASESESFSKIDQISESGIIFPNYSNPIELYSVMLNGGALALPSDIENKNIGFWSDQISNADGTFSTPIILTLTADEYYSSSGIFLEFDSNNDIFPNEVNIKWYRDDNPIFEKDFIPTSAYYYFEAQVEFYNKVVITFRSLNMPYNRLKIRDVEHGRKIDFVGRDLKGVTISHKMNPISAELPISTASLVIDTSKNMNFYFQERQPLKVLFNDELQSQVFVKNAKRISKKSWSIKAEDYIGIMDGVQFYGGMYESKNASSLLQEIFDTAKVPFDIDDALLGETITGHIPFTTCRNALMQVLFAIGAAATTANLDYVKVYKLSDDNIQVVPLNRIFQGQAIEEETRVTEVSVTSHIYKPIEETLTVYEASKSGIGEDILVKFNQPLHDLSIINGTINESGANYAIINALDGCVLMGEKYEHSTNVKSRKNPLVLTTDTDNVKTISNATLISQSNIDNVLDTCYNYYAVNKTARMKIKEGETPTSVGDRIEFETEYLGNLSGRISSQVYSLVGNTIVKDTTLKM